MATPRLSTWVALRCREPEFLRFLGVPDEATCAAAVRAICNIQSRRELDTNPTAAQRCHQMIRIPYSDFLKDQ